MTGIIYKWTNKVTNKCYIGQTIDPEQRKANHICEAFKRGSDYYFHRSLRKYGLDAFNYEVLEQNIERCDLNDRENYYIDKYDSICPNGYNQCRANSLDETAIEKMRQTKKRQWLEMNESEKQKRREHLRKIASKPQSENQKKKVAAALQKEWIITHPDGKQEKIVNLQQFCRDKGWGSNGQSNLVRGSYKGYKAVKA